MAVNPSISTINPVFCRLGQSASADIAAIEAVSNRPPWPVSLFANEFQHSYSYTYGARADGKLIGFLVLHSVLDELHILNFGIDPNYRGRGVGKGLLFYALLDGHERGVHWATLEVRKSNSTAQNLYRAFGFSEVAVRPKYYSDDQEDGLVLRLNIPVAIADQQKLDADKRS